MSKRLYFLSGSDDVYNKALAESVIEELKELYSGIECKYVSGFRDLFRADIVVASGSGSFSRKSFWGISILRKPLVAYHISVEDKYFQRFSRNSKWVVTSKKSGGSENYDYYPSPVFLSDLATSKRINRIWSKEKLVSKRGCIGIIGLALDEGLQKKLAVVLDLLVEDLDLNIIFMPVLESDSVLMQEVLSQIKFSANTRYIRTQNYSCSEVFGIISNIDILITGDPRGAICAMAANRPVIALTSDGSLRELLDGVVREEVLLDMDTLSCDEIYTKIKIAWVHRDAIVEQIRKRINELKLGASEGIRQLGKKVLKF